MDVLDQVEDEKYVIRHHDYMEFANKSLPLIDWAEEELVELNEVTSPMIKYSKQWANHKILQLEDDGLKLSYYLMGNLESKASSEDKFDAREQERGE